MRAVRLTACAQAVSKEVDAHAKKARRVLARPCKQGY